MAFASTVCPKSLRHLAKSVTSVEIDCGWLEEESRNKIGVNASPQELDAVQRMAEEAGVKVTALGGGAVVGLYGDVAEDRCDELMKVIDHADALNARVIRVFTEHDFTHSKHYVLLAERVTDALYETLSAAFNKLGATRSRKMAHWQSRITAAHRPRAQGLSGCWIWFPTGRWALPTNRPTTPTAARTLTKPCSSSRTGSSTRTGRTLPDPQQGLSIAPLARATSTGRRSSARLNSFDGIWAVEYERKVDSTLETLKAGSVVSRDNLRAVIEQVQSA